MHRFHSEGREICMSKIRKYKNKIIVACSIIVVLFACYLFGQNVVLPIRMEKAGYLNADGEVPKYSIMEHYNEFDIAGQKEADVPGSQSISMLTLNTDNSDFSEAFLGTSLFMLPGTSISNTMRIKGSYQELSFLCGICPNITKDVSDGAEVVVSAYRKDSTTPIWQEIVSVEPEQGLNEVSVSLEPIQGKKVRLEISCSAGEAGNEDGDWVMIKNPSIN